MVTQITMIPELNLGIIVLTNQEESGAFQSITDQIKDAYFNMNGTDRVTQYSAGRKTQMEWSQKFTDSIWAEVEKVQKQKGDKTDLVPYAGTYHDNWFGDIVISVKNGKGWFASKRSPKLTGELLPYKGNSFVVKWLDRSMAADAFVNFGIDKSGKAVTIKMQAVSPLTDFSYDFNDLDFSRVK